MEPLDVGFFNRTMKIYNSRNLMEPLDPDMDAPMKSSTIVEI